MHFDAYCTVLAGGIGRRFWPASTPDRPKQFLPLAGPTPLLDETLARATGLVGAGRVRVLASGHLVRLMRPALEDSGIRALVEPRARGTGPGARVGGERNRARGPRRRDDLAARGS